MTYFCEAVLGCVTEKKRTREIQGAKEDSKLRVSRAWPVLHQGQGATSSWPRC